ncbi:MAG TPA: DivIVA domain-containing protein [Acidimicrobiales bacterium]|nr:DivIVA domain-containing protein [Acidimicrobiales bacterium]
MTTLDDALFDIDDLDDQPAPGPAPAPPVEESPARTAPSRWVREAVFREKLRGYHPADVDAFLDQVAFAFDELEARLADAEDRAVKAAGDAAVVVADDDTVRRTLTLAQRTAELAIAEAERQAATLVESAQAEAERLVRHAEAEAAEVRERERSKLEAELTHLESARAIAAEDLDALDARRRREHARLTAILTEVAAVVESQLGAD